jgi:hypothetical protein
MWTWLCAQASPRHLDTCTNRGISYCRSLRLEPKISASSGRPLWPLVVGADDACCSDIAFSLARNGADMQPWYVQCHRQSAV